VAAINGGDLSHVEAFSNRDNGGIDHAKGQISVGGYEF
jgi:hypothetical protein